MTNTISNSMGMLFFIFKEPGSAILEEGSATVDVDGLADHGVVASSKTNCAEANSASKIVVYDFAFDDYAIKTLPVFLPTPTLFSARSISFDVG